MADWLAIYLWHLPFPLALCLAVAACSVRRGDSWEALGKLAAGVAAGLVVTWAAVFGAGM